MAVSSITQQDMQRARRPKRQPQQPAQTLPAGYTAGKPISRNSTPLAPTPQAPTDGRELIGNPNVRQPVAQPQPGGVVPNGKAQRDEVNRNYGTGPQKNLRGHDGLMQMGENQAETRVQDPGVFDRNAKSSIPGGYGQPTVATTDTPVITRTPGAVEPETMGAPDYSGIQGMDQEGLMDYIDMMNVRASRGQPITEQEQLNLMKANRMLQAQQLDPQDPYAGAIQSAEELRAQELERVKAQADEYYQGRQGEIESMAQRRIDEATQAGEKTQQAVAQQLSFSGFGRSTYAGEKQAEVQQAVNRNIETAQQRRDAELARAQAERDGASADVIARYDTYIDGLRTESTKYNNELVQQMNEYNAQNTQSYQDKVNNILQLAQTMGSDAPLTEEETALAKSYASLAINSKGELNNAFLQNVPPTLLPAVIAEASLLKGAIPPEQQQGDYGFINVGGGMVAVTDPFTGEVTYQQGNVQNNPEDEQKVRLNELKIEAQQIENEQTKQKFWSDQLKETTDPILRAEIITEQRAQTRADGTMYIPQGKRGNQCGEFVNDAIGTRVFGDSIDQKISKINSEVPEVGGAVVIGTGNQYGHVAIVNSVDLENGTITLTESNADSNGSVTTNRTLSLDDPNIKGFYVPDAKSGVDSPAMQAFGLLSFDKPTLAKQEEENLKKIIERGDQEQIRTKLEGLAKEGLGATAKNDYEATLVMVNSLQGIEETLNRMKELGVDTGLLQGKYENLTQRFGATGNPQLARLGVTLKDQLDSIRRARSGAALTEFEEKFYDSIFPSNEKNYELNMATLNGFRDSRELQKESYLSQAYGPTLAQEIWSDKGGDTEVVDYFAGGGTNTPTQGGNRDSSIINLFQ